MLILWLYLRSNPQQMLLLPLPLVLIHWKEGAFSPLAPATYYNTRHCLNSLMELGDAHPLPWHLFLPSRGKGQANGEWGYCEHQRGEWINADTEHKSGMSQGRFSGLQSFYVETVVRKKQRKEWSMPREHPVQSTQGRCVNAPEEWGWELANKFKL